MKETERKITLGYAPTITLGAFSVEKGIENKLKTRKLIESWGIELVDIEDVSDGGFLPKLNGLGKIIKKFKGE